MSKLHQLILRNTVAYSKTCQTSKMERLANIVKGLTLFSTVLTGFFLTSKISESYKLVINLRKLFESHEVLKTCGLGSTGFLYYQMINDKDLMTKAISASHIIISGDIQI